MFTILGWALLVLTLHVVLVQLVFQVASAALVGLAGLVDLSALAELVGLVRLVVLVAPFELAGLAVLPVMVMRAARSALVVPGSSQVVPESLQQEKPSVQWSVFLLLEVPGQDLPGSRAVIGRDLARFILESYLEPWLVSNLLV